MAEYREHNGTGVLGRKQDINPSEISSGAVSSISNTVVGNQIATHSDGEGNSTDINETITSLSISTNILTYTKEDGTSDNIDLSLYLDDSNLSRIVSGVIDGAGIVTFTRDDASTFTIDFSTLLDTNDIDYISSVSLVGTDLVITSTGNAFSGTIDLSSLLDDTNLARIVSGSYASGNLTLTRDDASDIVIDVSDLQETLTSMSIDTSKNNITYTDEDGSDTVINLEKDFIEINGVGSIDLSETAATITTLPLGNTIDSIGSSFSNAGGVVTFSGDDGTRVKISYSISAVNNETGTRSTSVHALNVNGRQARSERYGYHRTNGDGFDNPSYTGHYILNDGNTISIESNVRVNGEDVDVLLEQTNLIIEIK